MAEIYGTCLRLTEGLILGRHSECVSEVQRRRSGDVRECVRVINEPEVLLRFDRCRSLLHVLTYSSHTYSEHVF